MKSLMDATLRMRSGRNQTVAELQQNYYRGSRKLGDRGRYGRVRAAEFRISSCQA